MKRILVTGFMPFGGEKMNPAWEAAARLEPEMAGVEIVRVMIPVSYARSRQVLTQQLAQFQPSALILLGQAGGRAQITPERFARNEMRAASADSDGILCEGEIIDADGPYLLSSELALRLADESMPLSENAGLYVCNCLYYHALSHFEGPCVFIHVPYCEQSMGIQTGQPYMPMNEIAEKIRQTVHTVAEAL